MTPARRSLRRNDPASTRDLILQEAMRLIARDGVEELRVKDLADAVGIRAPSVYKHFANRDAILGAVAETMVAEIGRFLRPDPSLAPVAWLEAWARAHVWFFASRPAYVVLILREMAMPGGFEALEAAVGPAAEAFRAPPLRALNAEFRSVYATGVQEGVFRPMDLAALGSMVLGAVLSAIAWPYGGKRQGELGAAELMRLQDDVVTMLRALTGPRA